LIKGILFDFGGVLVRTEDHAGRRRWEQQCGLAAGELDKLVFDSPAAVRATVGAAPEAEVWAHLAATLGLDEAQLDACRRDFWAGDRLDPDLVALMRDLRRRYRVGVLSNAWSGAREQFTRVHALDQAADVIIISSEEGLAKPDARLFRLAAERLGVRPEETVLVDDFIANVEGARAAGMKAILFKAGMDVRAALKALSVSATAGAEE
jgi:epoxide hydrolase-like predicted phosphatase